MNVHLSNSGATSVVGNVSVRFIFVGDNSGFDGSSACGFGSGDGVTLGYALEHVWDDGVIYLDGNVDYIGSELNLVRNYTIVGNGYTIKRQDGKYLFILKNLRVQIIFTIRIISFTINITPVNNY